MTSTSGRDSDEPREGIVLPPNGEPWDPRVQPKTEAGLAVPSSGQPWGQPWGPGQQEQPRLPAPQPAAPELPREATPPQPAAPPAPAVPPLPAAAAPEASGQGVAQRPAQAGDAVGDPESTAQIRALSQRVTPPRPAHPPVDNEGATQLIPPVTADQGATQLIPPVVNDQGATQVLPPVAGDDTTQLRAVRPRRRHAGAPAAPPAQPTRPVPPTAVHSDFNGLYRDAPQARTAPGTPPPPPGRAARRAGGGGGGPRRLPGALVAAVVTGCAVIGLVAGAAFSGGGEEPDPASQSQTGEGQGDGGQSGDDGEGAPGAPADDEQDGQDAAARQQAEELSALLADSNDSRDAVISAVENIRNCRRLPQAAEDLRGAAEQREGLVDRLGGLSLDALPDGEALASALAEGWEASAEADDHYADWAEDIRGDRGLCRGGRARHTGSATEGDSASAAATQAKERAATLWNPLAQEYGLPARTASQL